MRDSRHTMRRAGRATTTTAKTGWQSEALRDYALKTGELNRAIAFIKLKYYFGDAPAAHLDVCNFRAAVYLSQLLAAAGQGEQALALRRAASSWIRCQRGQVFYGRFAPPARLGSAARRQAGRGARRTGGVIPFRVLRELVVHHKLRSLVAAAPWRSRDSRPSPPTCGAMSTRSAASSKRCADTGTCRGAETRPLRIEQGNSVSERECI